ncbi:helix-turn-helix domain-containing protein [Streptomyces sp. AHA2]|uniref:helix-turn-helix domain-containing protein n=1 Tax=Streptomyces sp. AHA2 TaxID=3064526 RepID=UPI002FE0D7D6
MASLNVGNLGDYLREQRRNAQLSLRQLADAAGVSNPYLSQIERGLRKPSAEVLQQVAKALRISAETLYVRAGILDADRDRDEAETRAVILADPTLNERQKQVLLQIYESFRKENGFTGGEGADGAAGVTVPDGSAVLGVVDRDGPAEAATETDPSPGDGDGGIPVADRPRSTGRRRRDDDGGATARTTGGARARRPRRTDGGTTAGSDTDPQQTAG